MKILLFTENTYAGGLDSFIVNLVNYWPNPQDDFVLVCNESHPGLSHIKERVGKNLQIHPHKFFMHWQLGDFFAQIFWVPLFLKRAFSALIKYPLLVVWVIWAKKIINRIGPDRMMVINGGYPAGDSCRAAVIAWGRFNDGRPPCVLNFHNLATKARWWERFLEAIIDWYVARACKVIVAVSKACADSMDYRPIVKNSNKVTYVYNGVSGGTAEFDLQEVRQTVGLSEDAPMCLMLGTYEPRKGHDFLFEAFSKVLRVRPDTRLVICGFGYNHDFERVQNLVEKKGLQEKVRLENFRDDVVDLIFASDILVVPSQSFESFGLTIVEAMAQSTPVVATNVGGIPEVLGNNEGGICCEKTDVDSFAQAIILLLENEALKEETGQNGYRRFKKLFTADRMALKYSALLQ